MAGNKLLPRKLAQMANSEKTYPRWRLLDVCYFDKTWDRARAMDFKFGIRVDMSMVYVAELKSRIVANGHLTLDRLSYGL